MASEEGEQLLRSSAEFSRRRFLRVAGGVAGGAMAVPLLAACVPTAPTAAPTRPAAAVPTSAGAAANAVYPRYTPFTGGPKADYPAEGPMYEDGFNGYPANPFKAIAEVPGAGSNVNIMSIQLFPPPAPLDQNPAWQEVNKQLNANVQFNVIPPGDYAAKIGTMMAGDDLPDIMLFPGGLNVTIAQSGTANLPQFLQTKAADLEQFIAVNIPTLKNARIHCCFYCALFSDLEIFRYCRSDPELVSFQFHRVI